MVKYTKMNGLYFLRELMRPRHSERKGPSAGKDIVSSAVFFL